MGSSCLARVVSSDVKHNFFMYYLAAFGVLLVTPVIFGLEELDSRMSAIPLEIMPLFMGMILLTPVLSPEQNESILEVVRSKKMSRQLVTGMRIICSLAVLALLVGILCGYMRYSNCDVTLKMYAGAFAGAFALGSLGFFFSAVTDNTIIGYMTSMMFFIMNLFMKNRLGIFTLMAMSSGTKTNKLFLAGMAVVLIVTAMIYRSQFAENRK